MIVALVCRFVVFAEYAVSQFVTSVKSNMTSEETDYTRPHIKGAHVNTMDKPMEWYLEPCLCWLDKMPISKRKSTRRVRSNGKHRND